MQFKDPYILTVDLIITFCDTPNKIELNYFSACHALNVSNYMNFFFISLLYFFKLVWTSYLQVFSLFIVTFENFK